MIHKIAIFVYQFIRKVIYGRAVRYTNEIARYRDFEIGDYTYGKPLVYWWGGSTKLKIGKYCSLAPGSTFVVGGEHSTRHITTYPFISFSGKRPDTGKGNVVIGNDVWIGLNALVLSGVTIGDGAVIGAGCVVTKDVAPYAIVAGNPARLIRYRFSPETIESLLKIKWWDWPHEKVMASMDILDSPDLEKFKELVEAK